MNEFKKSKKIKKSIKEKIGHKRAEREAKRRKAKKKRNFRSGTQLVHLISKTIHHFFPDLFDRIREIEDYRKKSEYELAELITGAFPKSRSNNTCRLERKNMLSQHVPTTGFIVRS
ncbi:MAG: hypothetical protein D3916_13680 [Candidatus Electrothrix sp. MAN1_4]|nr:hypothetical protein [Candidatus Electrothrix sp. MAN1_4]